MASKRVTLDHFWLSFMPVYVHFIAIMTHLLTVLALYLMLRKTPDSGKALARYLMILQINITLNDLIFGVLFGPIVLYPAPAIICTGFLCANRLSVHIIANCTFFSMFYTAMSLLFCFHYKYLTILEMTRNKRSTVCVNRIFCTSSQVVLDGTDYLKQVCRHSCFQ
ncbi:hypothetical protein PFISCL1PPCAC_14417 [Pristionchus fissidentatus]|uniref:G protein-coupled receptor n=1 Tax=Pristionchus fissidentatus TaxID=1538716 RepID=A0AAV5VUC9_9BILA|nr:hypothetical protein PFISCL1PPCAC_14417 [Pristionchus fissidentatus]